MQADAVDPEVSARRFGGVARALGTAAAARIAAAHVVVVGVGGVGSWTAEALARCGVGRLTLIDLDHIAESNVNRQIHALGATLGQAKVQAMAARIADISPQTQVLGVEAFIEAQSVAAQWPADADVVVDAIDAPRAKAALIAQGRAQGVPVVVCGAAGGRTDPLDLRRSDLTEVRSDALLAAVRARLRREHGFSREAGVRFGVTALWAPAPPGGVQTLVSGEAGMPLACAGYGSLVTVTAAMGLAAASEALRVLPQHSP